MSDIEFYASRGYYVFADIVAWCLTRQARSINCN